MGSEVKGERVYAWFVGDALVPPPCGMGPMFVKARSKKKAARIFWNEFRKQLHRQLTGNYAYPF